MNEVGEGGGVKFIGKMSVEMWCLENYYVFYVLAILVNEISNLGG